jgi:DNA topoisomerase 2-associated protein PAT1
MRIILERHNLLWFAKSRVGLVILTMMLSRAELLKQGVVSPESGQLPEQELGMWSEIYEFMFSSFKGQFPALFSTETLPADEVFVWQFLSAMAVGASGIDHQKVLVTELRENIIQTAKTNHPKALENVNLFLTALGLNIDAAQLAAMSQ